MDDYNSFSTIDHLVEFGDGNRHCTTNGKHDESLYWQYAGTRSRQHAYIRQAYPQYHILANNAVAGAFSEEELNTLAKAKTLTSETMVWKPGMSGWMQAKNVPEIQKIILLNT